jgi:hypothetical protein
MNLMIKEKNICRKCILPDGFLGVHLNSEGLCEFCCDETHKNINWSRTKISLQRKRRALFDWENAVKDMQKSQGGRVYDCMLGYSGGKDSTALMDYLVNELYLKPLVITIDTGFMTDIAKNNMKQSLQRLQVDHVLIEECIPTFTKLYKWHFLNHHSNEAFLTRRVCDSCSDLIHSIIVKEALEREIPYVFFGYSPDQIFRYFYEIPKHEIINKWKPKILDSPFFNDSDRKWYLTNKEINKETLPRVLFPYHVLPYREQDVISLVESKNYIKKGHADPLLTNCNVVHAATFYDFNRYGGILYVYQYAELVRQDPSLREKWLRTLTMAAPLILENKFKQKEVNAFLEQIGVSQERLLTQTKRQLEKDPNREHIELNIQLFQKKKRSRVSSSIIH